MSTASNQMAVVSPCSGCKNFNDTSGNGPICPRRYRAGQADNTRQNDTPPPQPQLTDSGTADPAVLANPGCALVSNAHNGQRAACGLVFCNAPNGVCAGLN